MASKRPTAALSILLALVAGACQTGPAPVARQAWILLESPHFEMWSALPATTAQPLIEDLERFRSALPSLARIEPPDATTRIIVFHEPDALERFRRAPIGPGIAVATLRGPVIAVDGSSELARDDLRHGFVHTVLRGETEPIPAWYEEGLAEYLALASFEGDQVHLGGLSKSLARRIQLGNPLGLRRVLGARSSRVGWSRGALERFGAQSWALVHLLRSPEIPAGSRPVGTPPTRDRHAALAAAALRSVEDPDAVIEDATGGLQAEFNALLRQVAWTRITIKSELPPAPGATVRAVDPAEALALLADLATELGADDDVVQGLHRAASAQDPGQRWSALETARRDPAIPPREVARMLEALEAEDAQDGAAWARIGDQWRALSGSAPQLAEGRAANAYHRALEANPAQVDAVWGLAATFGSAPEDHAAAAMLLRRASMLAPAIPRVELTLAERLIASGRPAPARDLLDRLARRPHVGATLEAKRIEEALGRAGISLADLDVRLSPSHLEVHAPAENAALEQLAPWAEVSGAAGLGGPGGLDVVIAFDHSGETRVPSKLDINQNGRVGRIVLQQRTTMVRSAFPEPPREYHTDPGDSLLEAELLLARTLIDQLDPRTTRVALVRYGTSADVLVPLGPPDAVDDAISEYRQGASAPIHSNVRDGLLQSLAALRNGETDEPRRTSIFLLGVRSPSYPNAWRARRLALEVADFVARAGVRVHTFGLGPILGKRTGALLADVSEITGGAFTHVANPWTARVPDDPRRLAGLEDLEIRNATTGEAARAVRVFADGSFDGLVPLAVGQNQIQVVARLTGRPTLHETRVVEYTRPEEATVADRRRAAVLLYELRNRSIEVATQLEIAEARAAQASGADAGQRGTLTLELEDAADDQIPPPVDVAAPAPEAPSSD